MHERLLRIGSRNLGLRIVAALAVPFVACSPPAPPVTTVFSPAPTPTAATPAPSEFKVFADTLRDGSNAWLGLAPRRELRERVAAPGLDQPARFQALMLLSVLETREGENESAIQHCEEAGALLEVLLPKMSEPARDAIRYDFLRARALAYLRHAESQNCVAHHGLRSCILPIEGDGVHVDPGPARQSLGSWYDILELRPDDGEARWFVNLLAMTLGEFPEAVPVGLRLDFARHQTAGLPRFHDVAATLGIDRFDLAGGVAIEDFDGDGLLDIIESTSDPDGSLAFFRRDEGGGFEDRTAAAGLAEQLGGLNLIATDYDNDGDADFLVLRGGWLLGDGRIRRSLLKNDGRGHFSDVTRAAGLAEPAYPSQAACWADFDRDGDLDLFVGNEVRELGNRVLEAFPSQLFQNDAGKFSDIATSAGVTNDLQAKGVACGDFDNDGDIDLYVSNIGANRLYRNDGALQFIDVAKSARVVEPSGRSFVPWFFDFDEDGWLDLWVGAYDAGTADLANHLAGKPFSATPPRLYRNQHDGTFVDVAATTGLANPYRPMGANFGDIDGDGWLDIYLGTGDPDFASVMPNVMLRNNRGRGFQDVTTATGLGHLQKGHGIAFADFDGDGDQDIYHQIGGFFRGDKFANALFANPGPCQHFLYLRLSGRRSNRAGLGTRVTVRVMTTAGPRDIHRAPGAVSSFGGSSLSRLEIGLGNASAIRELEVWWPASGERQLFRDVAMDQLITLVEGHSDYEVVPLASVPLLAKP